VALGAWPVALREGTGGHNDKAGLHGGEHSVTARAFSLTGCVNMCIHECAVLTGGPGRVWHCDTGTRVLDPRLQPTAVAKTSKMQSTTPVDCACRVGSSQVKSRHTSPGHNMFRAVLAQTATRSWP